MGLSLLSCSPARVATWRAFEVHWGHEKDTALVVGSRAVSFCIIGRNNMVTAHSLRDLIACFETSSLSSFKDRPYLSLVSSFPTRGEPQPTDSSFSAEPHRAFVVLPESLKKREDTNQHQNNANQGP